MHDMKPLDRMLAHVTEDKIGPSNILEPGDVITVYERYF
jgi:hypothetical protein